MSRRLLRRPGSASGLYVVYAPSFETSARKVARLNGMAVVYEHETACRSTGNGSNRDAPRVGAPAPMGRLSVSTGYGQHCGRRGGPCYARGPGATGAGPSGVHRPEAVRVEARVTEVPR